MSINRRITSQSNAEIKRLKSLGKKKFRTKYGEFLIEGIRSVEHGIEQGLIKEIYVSDSFWDNERNQQEVGGFVDNNLPITVVDDKIFRDLSDTETPQGIIGVAKIVEYSLENIIEKDSAMILILDRVQDPGNLGTLIRTADAAGADGVVIAKGSVDYCSPKVVRSAMGSSLYMPIYLSDNLLEDIEKMKAKGVTIYGTDLRTENYYDDLEYSQKTAIIIGNEGNGIEESVLEQVDERIKIPLVGKAESLNASVAGSIILYEIVRQRRVK